MAKTFWALFLIAGVVLLTGAVIMGERNDNPKPPDVYPEENTIIKPDQTNTQIEEPAPSTVKKPDKPSAAPTTSTPNVPANPAPTIPTISTTSVCNTTLINPDGFDSMRVISKEACDLVNNLYKEGKAAGNFEDTYENRDRLHVNFCDGWAPSPDCPMANRLFPQHKWLLSAGTGRASEVQSGITVGQASHSGETANGVKHSIAYSFYKTESGASILYNQYTKNNIYIYPALEESKKDNIANTPYVISSEYFGKDSGTYFANAASGSDLPFVKIVMLALGSLQPQVKTTLKNSSHLIPTVQMLIRHAHGSVNNEGDYLSSAAHDNTQRAHYLSGGLPQPNYNSAKLVRLANDLTVSDVPPLAKIRVISEDFAENERLFNTPSAIARSVPTGTSSRTITISAADSADINGNKSGLAYEWRVLKGGSKVKISKDASDPSKAVIEFTLAGAGERLDVGVFVKKADGKYYSVPAIISMYTNL